VAHIVIVTMIRVLVVKHLHNLEAAEVEFNEPFNISLRRSSDPPMTPNARAGKLLRAVQTFF
jgi:hypothetical protein